ncbi:MAG: helix-turn-helix transcriptional regulator [Clostridia bacterium]|nr:helix-turn-helix transcriptional regulator [Clostridia bacterium]
MKFSERLGVELKASGLTQKEIAEKLHINPANITNWKKGINIPSLEVFYELCKILDVSADYLLGLTD